MTFAIEDLLNEQFLNKSNRDFHVTEARSPTMGKCFTLKVDKLLGLHEPFIFILKKSFDLKVYIHNDGEEFWVSWMAFGPQTNMIRLNIESDTETVMTILGLTEKEVEHYPKYARPCRKSNSGLSKEEILKEAANHRSFPTENT